MLLSEADSKRLLGRHGISVPAEEEVRSPAEAAAAADRIGFPVVAKLCGAGIAHKMERGLVRLRLGDQAAVTAAATDLLAAVRPEDGEVTVLVGAMMSGTRELIAGAVRDPQFGPSVMLGVGGVLAEALADVAFRLAPVTPVEAEELIDDLAGQSLLGPFRGEPEVNRRSLVQLLVALGEVVVADASIRSIDVNPLIVCDGVPVAVDALVEVDG
jgi:succinyl-CoA synthetase beta subunit